MQKETSQKETSLTNIIKLIVKRFYRDNIMGYAYHVAYNLLLSFFPFLIFLITLVGYANLDSSVILSSLEDYLPDEVYSLVAGIITDVVDHERNGLMSFSFLFSVYAASGGFRAFMEASNRALGIKESRNIFFRYFLSAIFVILFAAAIVFALLGIVFGQQIIHLLWAYFDFLPFKEILRVLGVLLPILLIFLLFLSFYIFVPAQKVCFRCAVTGAVFATAGWIVFTMIFQFYVNNYSNYSRFYGALGTVIVLLLWLLLTSVIMLVGVEINAVLLDSGIIKGPDAGPGAGPAARSRRKKSETRPSL